MKARGIARRGIEYFESLAHQEGQKFTPIETAERLLTLLGNPQEKVRAIHVAGTNGKGSVCALLAAMFRANGANVGQTSSPHLCSVAERILVNGHPLPDENFSEALDVVLRVADGANLSPSYFVLGVVTAFYEFALRKLDWMFIEVGMGGRYDATNVIPRPEATVITSISLDHTEFLGATLGEIARVKAGISKAGVPLFVGEVVEEARGAIREEVTARGAAMEAFGQDFFYDEGSGTLRSSSGSMPVDFSRFPLFGEHQRRNAVLAARVATALGLSGEVIQEGLERVRWPGRLEYFELKTAGMTERRITGSVVGADRLAQANLLADVAHNPEGISVLLDYLRGVVAINKKSLTVVLSVVGRKDWRTMLVLLREGITAIFAPHMKGVGAASVKWLFTHSGNPGAVPPETLQEFFGEGEVFQDPEEALLKALRDQQSDGLILLTGSVFLIGRLRPFILGHEEIFTSIAPKSLGSY